VHLPLHATALWLEQGGTQALILDLDHLLLPTPDCTVLRAELARAAGLPPEHVRISCSHTHAGPPWTAGTGLGFGPDLPGMELVDAYRDATSTALARIAREAAADARPARAAAGYGTSGVTVNRRLRTADSRTIVSQNPAGYRDTTLTILRLDDLHERPIATIVGYGTHPIVLAFQNRLISPDFPGTTRRVVEDLVGGACLFLQGCAADQIPIEALTGDTTVAERIGRRLGVDAAAVALGLRTRRVVRRVDRVVESGAPLGIQVDDALPDADQTLAVRSETVALPLRDWGDPAARRAEADALMALLERADRNRPEELAELGQRAKRAAMRARWAATCAGRTTLPVEVMAIRIGDAVLIGTPLEPFARTGADIRAGSPFAVTHMAGYANGYEGYLPPADEFPLGGYETEWASPFTDAAEARLRQGVLDCLRRLKTA